MTARPRIAHVINSLGLGGVPQLVCQLLAALPRDGHDLLLYVLKSYPDHPEARLPQAERFRELGVTVRFPRRDEKKFHVVGELCRWLQQDRIDILHTHSYKPNIYGRLAGTLCRSQGVRIIAHYHNHYDNKWEEDDSLVYEQLLAHSCDRFLACSESVGRHVAERIGIAADQIRVVLNGIDLERFRRAYDRRALRAELGIAEEVQVVGMVGRLCRQKAQDVLLQAAPGILRQCPDTLFLLAGAADEPTTLSQLQRQAFELGLGNRVRFLGYVSDIPRVYAALDVLAMPSRWEGFGLALAEAMAMGVPVVATPVGGIPEVAGDGALMVAPDAPAELAEAIAGLLADPARAAALGRVGSVRAERFCHRRIGREVQDIYRELLAGNAP
jgi:glycosyltransferase involved in cell wall biosynthesis